MKSNELNVIAGNGDEKDDLKKLGNRIKTLRIKAGHTNYEKFAFNHNIGRTQLRRYELGKNLQYASLLRVIKALNITIAEFFSEGLE